MLSAEIGRPDAIQREYCEMTITHAPPDATAKNQTKEGRCADSKVQLAEIILTANTIMPLARTDRQVALSTSLSFKPITAGTNPFQINIFKNADAASVAQAALTPPKCAAIITAGTRTAKVAPKTITSDF